MTTKQLKVLLPSSFPKLRISDELAGCFDAGDGMTWPTALVSSPFGIWPIEVGRNGDGAFLGRGWTEFAGAHGIDVGWFLVLRHVERGVLTVKAFDTSCCLKKFGPAPPRDAATGSITHGGACRPQFIKVLLRGFMEMMPIPPEFVQRYISEDLLHIRMASVMTPPTKVWHIKLEKDRTSVFFAGGWSKFLEFHGINEADALLLKYKGNMIFTIKVFGPNGSQKELKNQGNRFQQTERSKDQTNQFQKTAQKFTTMERQHEPSSSSREQEESSSMKSQQEAPSSSRKLKSKKAGRPYWIKKKMTSNALQRYLTLKKSFCVSIGFLEHCTITLKTSMDNTQSWEVCGHAYQFCNKLGRGWNIFCQENKIKEGDTCTFSIVEARLWHVVIQRS